jgi:hypothetical protein
MDRKAGDVSYRNDNLEKIDDAKINRLSFLKVAESRAKDWLDIARKDAEGPENFIKHTREGAGSSVAIAEKNKAVAERRKAYKEYINAKINREKAEKNI